jgi:hypothetical protein
MAALARTWQTVTMRLLLVAPLACLGCAPSFIVTDSFTPPPESAFATPPDSLHGYVVGTEVRLDVRAARAFVDLNAVAVISRNPDIVEVLRQVRVPDGLRVLIRTVAVGTAALAFLDDQQRPLEERVIEVGLPDDVLLAVNIDTDHGYTIPPVDQDALLIAIGGTATFRVRYALEGKELSGKGILRSPASLPFAFANPIARGPDMELLSFTAPAEPGEPIPITLEVDGSIIKTLLARATPLTQIAAIELDEGALPWARTDGDRTTVWAKAFTSTAAPVFGVPFAWAFDSAALPGVSDLVTYAYSGGERRRIQVGAGDIVADLTVEAARDSAALSSTASAGCAATPVPLALALLALPWRHRARSLLSRARR